MFEDKKPPSPSALERAGAIVKAAASVNPAAAAATETLAQMLGHVFGSRRDAWLEALAARVEELERERGITLEDLAKNQAFLDAVFQASAAAARTHREERREALRNAVINSALPGSPSEDLQQIFIGYVEQLTPFHLKMLKVFVERLSRSRNAYTESRRLHEVLRDHHPELLSGGLLDLVCEDLVARGLVSKSSGGRGGWAQETMGLIVATGFGQEFLKFVSAPEVR